MEKARLNYLHLFNEFSMLVMVYMVLGFSAAGGDAAEIFALGAAFSVVLVLMIVVNVIILTYDLIASCKHSRELKRRMRQLKDSGPQVLGD